MERETETLESTTGDLMPEADDFDELMVEPPEEPAPEVRLDPSNAQRRNLDARRRIEQLRDAQRLRNELDDWD